MPAPGWVWEPLVVLRVPNPVFEGETRGGLAPWGSHGPHIHLNPLFQCFVDCLGPSDGCRGGAERWQPWVLP